MQQLPCHFIWSDGRVSLTLDELIADADEDRGQVAWHLEEGHLQEALNDQGYKQITDGLNAAKDPDEMVELLLERLAVYHAMHRRWLVASDFRGYVGRLDKLFRARSASLLPSVGKKVGEALCDLANAVCAIEHDDAFDDDDDDEADAAVEKPATKARKASGRSKAADKPVKKTSKKTKKDREASKERLAQDTKRIAKVAKDAKKMQS